MNCDVILKLLNEQLDRPLTEAERATVHSHLLHCQACREASEELQSLHQDLTALLRPPPVEAAVNSILAAIQPPPSPSPALPLRVAPAQASPQSSLAVVASVCALLLVAAVCWTGVPAASSVAEISVVTGRIEVRPVNQEKWISTEGSRLSLAARTRVRTAAGSLCEIRTRSASIVRMNHETELVVHDRDSLELVRGELWCRASPAGDLRVSTPQPNLPTFTCPSATETQWTALADQALTCTATSSRPVELASDAAHCKLEPGERLTFADREAPGVSRRGNPLLATSWQLPLLVRRSPADEELQSRLAAMLATIGESKAAYLYESQIRDLGPLGALPLLAFVQSPRALEQPQLRERAMRLAADLASSSALPTLRLLEQDPDPQIQALARSAVSRLTPPAPDPNSSGT